MKHIISFLLLLLSFFVNAQEEQYDLVSYQAPKNWKKEQFTGRTTFTVVNNDTKSWCIIALYKSINSKGNSTLDFGNDWKHIVQKMYKTNAPQHTEASAAGGWSVQSGASKVAFDQRDAFVILTTFTGFHKTLNVLGTTNDSVYLRHVADFIGHISLNKPDSKAHTLTASIPTGFQFNTTNWDDGWISTIQADWVEVRKATNKVLVHYPNQQADAYNAVVKAGNATAWNLLVAPRYSDIRDYISSFKSVKSKN